MKYNNIIKNKSLIKFKELKPYIIFNTLYQSDKGNIPKLKKDSTEGFNLSLTMF